MVFRSVAVEHTAQTLCNKVDFGTQLVASIVVGPDRMNLEQNSTMLSFVVPMQSVGATPHVMHLG